jgi:peptidoglycan/LPS O-acetylase OafA/YrhL
MTSVAANIEANIEKEQPAPVDFVPGKGCTQIDQPAHSNVLVRNLSMREIPSLNGLRGAAALIVVFYHYLEDTKFISFFPGPYAVTLFFELSGLLITWLLLKELDAHGHLDWKQFYIRRALRLFPVFYAVWALCRLAGPFAGSWATFFYMGDYYHALTQRYNILTSAWSLGVEEKFYLLWPVILARVERTKLVKILCALLIAEPVYRSVLSALGHRAYTWFAFDTRFDAILVGCMIAMAARRGWHAPGWLSHPFTPICALILVLALQQQGDLVTYLLAVILVSVVCRPNAILNNPIARYFGAISYSLYLCHVYARDVVWQWLMGQGIFGQRILGTLQSRSFLFALATQLTIAIALASVLHFLVERPFLRLKSRLQKKQSPATC